MQSALDLALEWVRDEADSAIKGQGGHDTQFRVVCTLLNGFDLSEGDLRTAFEQYNHTKSFPPLNGPDLEHKLRSAKGTPGRYAPGWLYRRMLREKGRMPDYAKGGSSAGKPAVAAAPVYQPKWKLEFDLAALQRMQMPNVTVTESWLAERSVIDPATVDTRGFLDHVFSKGDKVLIFTKFASQGQFLYELGKAPDVLAMGETLPDAKTAQRGNCYQNGEARPMVVPGSQRKLFPGCCAASDGYRWYPVTLGCKRLAERPDMEGVPSVLPTEGPQGVWYLSQPVDEMWHPNPREDGKLSRRSEESVARWMHLVLECDEVGVDELWLNLLVQLPLPILAIYQSAGKSSHALVRMPTGSKEKFDQVKRLIGPLFSKLGADPRALKAVQLTRLPGCVRVDKGGRLQKLLYLDPDPEPSGVAIVDLVERVAKMPVG